MPEWISAFLIKLSGALGGSVIAAWFRRSARWGLQVVAGAFFGYVSGHWLMDFAGWPATSDYILLSGSIMGVCGYSILEAVLTPNWRAIFREWVNARAAGK